MTPRATFLCSSIAALLPCAPVAARAGGPESVQLPGQHGPVADEARQAEAARADEEGGFDFSKWLVSRKGFLPVPIIITEPAVGNGGGIAAIFIRQPRPRTDAEKAQHPHAQTQNLFGGGYAQTSNGSQFAFAGISYAFRDDHLRYRGGLAKVDTNLDFYGIGNATGDGARRIGFSLDGNISSQQVLWRLGERNDFIAARWLYLDLDSSIDRDEPPQPQPVGLLDTELVNSGVGLSLEHDSRDSIFTPSRGWTGAIETLFYDDIVGSDVEFETYRAYAFGWVPFAEERFVLGWRGDYRAARGDVPFYQFPYVDLRGIALGRYQDENVLVGEAELRWNFKGPWALVGFGGVARPWGRVDDFGDADSQRTVGAGVRYRLAKTLGLYAGIDAARGPESTEYYLTIGSAWR